MKASYLSKENLITTVPVNEGKIYIREQNGVYQQIRQKLSSLLILIFIAIPFFRYQGKQAVLFDVEQQTLQLFSFTLYPQDLFIFSLLFAIAAFALFYVTKLYGRVWCGFTCPQTVWTLMFNWVERRVEGTHNQSKALDSQQLSATKALKKTIKHIGWASISLFTALVFMSYFIPVEQLYLPFFQLESSALVTGWVIFFASCTYINAGWIREKMCLHMCPYARFQSAMFDSSTTLVTYDHERGENRGMRKRNQPKPESMGDCVDCDLCVQVCPVGIDIRNGLQYECINCALCIDACDQTMNRFNYAKGLIQFSKEKAPKNNVKRHAGYLFVISILLLSVMAWAIQWRNFEVNILRDRQALYRVNNVGDIENSYILKIRNKSSQTEHYQVTYQGLTDDVSETIETIEVKAGELKTVSVVLASSPNQETSRANIEFTLTALNSNHELTKPTSFYFGR